MMGITYRGKHSKRDIGVTVRTVSRPVMPPVRNTEEIVPYRDGSLDYSEQAGRLYYDDKILEIEISAVASDLLNLQRLINKVALWLVGGYDDLYFDDMPAVAWRARPIDVDGIAPELQRVGKTVVQFRCRPFNRQRYPSTGIPLNSAIPLDSDVPLNYGLDSKFDIIDGTNKLQYNYTGSAPCSPVFLATGSMTKISISCNGRSVSYAGTGFRELRIDCDAWTAIADGVDVSYSVAGDYPEFLPNAENEIVVTTNGAGTLILDFYPLFFYGGDI